MEYGYHNVTNITGNASSCPGEIQFDGNEYEFDLRFNYPKHIFEKSITPFIYILGFPGNSLSILIWLRPRMRQSSGCYLAALGLSHLVFLIVHVPYYLGMSWNWVYMNTPVVCEVYPFVSLAFQYLSPVLVLGFTVERYISICHPFKREKLCTQSRAMTVVACMYAGAFVLCTIQMYFWSYQDGLCDVRSSVKVGGPKSFWSIWTWITEMMIFLVVPLAILVFNIIVILEARRLSKAALRLMPRQQEHKSATTFMLLAVSFYVIFTTLPIALMYAVLLSFEATKSLCPERIFNDPVWIAHRTFMLIRSVVQMIGTSHYASNFYIYMLTGKLFRREVNNAILRPCFARCARKSKINTNSRNGTMTMYTSVPDSPVVNTRVTDSNAL